MQLGCLSVCFAAVSMNPKRDFFAFRHKLQPYQSQIKVELFKFFQRHGSQCFFRALKRDEPLPHIVRGGKNTGGSGNKNRYRDIQRTRQGFSQ